MVTQSLTIVALKVETASLVAVVDRSSAIIIAVLTQVRMRQTLSVREQLQHNKYILQIIFFDLIPNTISIGGMILVLVAGVLQSGWKYYEEVKRKQ